MALKIGIVGLPNVGKSTLFSAITKKQVDCANYPFCTIDPNIGVVAVPDERVDKLAELTKSAKKIYATVEFADIAGLVKGANKGEGLGNKFLANIREADAIVYVLRSFQNEKILNTQSSINVLIDKEILDTEMALKDLETVENRLESIKKEASLNKKEIIKEAEIIKKAHSLLSLGKSLLEQDWNEEERKILNNYQLLTIKPRLYLLNGAEKETPSDIIDLFNRNQWPFLIIDILTEFESAGFSIQERKEFGLPETSKLDELIQKAYQLLNLITFLTTGPDETRAWTFKKGQKSPRAGGVIHSDFEKNFIRAEVINWKDLLLAGGFSQARQKGLIRTEGKEYVVQDGDVIEIKIGV